ncbi:MAG: PLP-dependent aminotransferase family protein, partial [Clostridia bacterium]|nr:PLP-dependent aminotransferase family protein [Clostridia bacterium]
PSHQYPTGAVMPAANRSRLIGWAERTGAYIIEDDYDSEFRLFGKPLQTMAGLNGGRVIYLNTFSKTLAPSMRLGYMVLPPELYARYRETYDNSANVVPLFEQKALAKMLDGGYFERHVNRLKNHYRGVRAALLERIAALPLEKQVIETGGGLHITLHLPGFASDADIKSAAEERGIKIKCLSDYLARPCANAAEYARVAVINYSSVEIADLNSVETGRGK